MKYLNFSGLVLFFYCLIISQAFPQNFKYIKGDTLIYSSHIPDFVEKIITHQQDSIWVYYDYTDCADFFLKKENKDSSFIAFLNLNNIRVDTFFKSFDGYTEERCNLCKCPNGQRFNFKISKNDYNKLIRLFSGTMNQQKFIRY